MKAFAWIAALSLLASACGTTGERPASIDTLYSGGQCGAAAVATVTLIEGQARLDDFHARIASLEVTPHAAPTLDFAAQAAILIEMGSRSTGGYGLALAEPTALLRDGELEVIVEWSEPQPGMLLTQAITSPCLLLRVPGADYRRIVVRDRQGNIRAVWLRD